MKRIGQRETIDDAAGLIEQGWLQAVLVGVVVLLGVAVWWISTHSAQVARWINSDKPAPVEKPVVSKPTIQSN